MGLRCVPRNTLYNARFVRVSTQYKATQTDDDDCCHWEAGGKCTGVVSVPVECDPGFRRFRLFERKVRKERKTKKKKKKKKKNPANSDK